MSFSFKVRPHFRGHLHFAVDGALHQSINSFDDPVLPGCPVPLFWAGGLLTLITASFFSKGSPDSERLMDIETAGDLNVTNSLASKPTQLATKTC